MYTYGHTLSLHDALPICFETVEARIGASAGKILDVDIQRGIVAITGLALAAACGLDFGLGSNDARRARTGRSEEHTSKLQSLMRISYADLCFKHKHTQQ